MSNEGGDTRTICQEKAIGLHLPADTLSITTPFPGFGSMSLSCLPRRDGLRARRQSRMGQSSKLISPVWSKRQVIYPQNSPYDMRIVVASRVTEY